MTDSASGGATQTGPAFTAPGTLTPAITDMWDRDRSWTLKAYLAHGGYQGLKRAKTMSQDELVGLVKASNLRGRGGAGFPTGLKWSFLPAPDGGARYLVVNADESEPGTCKDIPTIMANPQALIEGVAICSRAIGCDHAFVYLRGEVAHVYRRLLQAVREATVRRFRPITLTAAAAILAMIPLSRDVLWGPMAVSIMGGLVVATALTLLMVPALYVAWYHIRPPQHTAT